MTIYVVSIKKNGVTRVSSEAYKNLADAIRYVESRPDHPSLLVDWGWIWETEDGKQYEITDVRVKE